MKVFVSGASGVVGRPAVRLLVEAGHSVTAAARSAQRAELLRSLGATPVILDLFDPAAVGAAVAGHDAVVNLATHIPPISTAALPGAWRENDRIRREVSRNLVDAALAAGATRLVQESICFFYRDLGERWIDEDVALDLPAYARSTADAEAQARRFTEAGGTGVVLRFGTFYGRHSQVPPALGRDGYVSSIHTDDAAAAVVAALRAPAGVYNVADDEPLSRREYAAAVAAAGGTRIRLLPPGALRLMGSKTTVLTRSQRVSNRRFREATGWAPRHASARDGWRAVAAAKRDASPLRGRALLRGLLAALALGSLVVGGWAALAPRRFYDGFPGLGRRWVAVDGPFNEHLVRDVGTLNLALFVVLAVAAVSLAPIVVRSAAAAALVFGTPHLIYHLAHLDVLPTPDRVANVLVLALTVAVPVAVLALSGGVGQQSPRRRQAAETVLSTSSGSEGGGPAVGGAAAGG
jgi:nucleoside-diphosphate-sugar epimerase